jgi:methionyl-tRNA formyltransferase
VPDPGEVPLAPAPSRPRRLVYLGTPEVAVPPLQALVDAGFDVALVVTGPDRRRGRGGQVTPSPVRAAAMELGLPVDHDLGRVTAVEADLGVVVAYGRIIPRHILERLAMVNLHFSLLPRWRGAAPVERALLAGDERTGVCLMEVAEGLDTGGVYASVDTEIRPDDTLESLRGRLVELGTRLLVDGLQAGLGEAAPQTGEPTHAAKIDPTEYRIDWTLPAARIDALVRLGGAHTTFRGRRLKVWGVQAAEGSVGSGSPGQLVEAGEGPAEVVVATGDQPLVLTVVQPEGKARQDAASWRNGARPEPGERLGE